MRKLRTTCAAAVGAAALLTVATLPADAATSGDTVTTFSLAGGPLSIAVQEKADLGTSSTGTTSLSGALGDVTVTDDRGGTEVWDVNAASTVFTSNTRSVSTGVVYETGDIKTGGTIDIKPDEATELTEKPVRVAGPSGVSGNNVAVWNPKLTVLLPSDALAGDYTGVITTSVA